MKTKLHHLAYNITPNSLELVIELLAKLECKVAYREKNSRWCLIKQKRIPVRIQLIEIKDRPIPIKKKINAHIAFVSNAPEEDIEKIKKWSKKKGVKFRQGNWSDQAMWFDLPDIFVNFVIEIMNTSIFE